MALQLRRHEYRNSATLSSNKKSRKYRLHFNGPPMAQLSPPYDAFLLATKNLLLPSLVLALSPLRQYLHYHTCSFRLSFVILQGAHSNNQVHMREKSPSHDLPLLLARLFPLPTCEPVSPNLCYQCPYFASSDEYSVTTDLDPCVLGRLGHDHVPLSCQSKAGKHFVCHLLRLRHVFASRSQRERVNLTYDISPRYSMTEVSARFFTGSKIVRVSQAPASLPRRTNVYPKKPSPHIGITLCH